MLRSLFAGVSGLQGHQTRLDVIGNNIANVNTIGFKLGRLNFADIISQTLSGASEATGTQGGINPAQVGLGTQVGSVDSIFTQGNFKSTGRLLDMSIQGSGFFAFSDGLGGRFVTKAGNISLDEEGYLVSPSNGYRLLGLMANSQGEFDPSASTTELQVDFSMEIESTVTENITMGGNLDSRTEPTEARSTTTLLSLFDEYGRALNLHKGDVIYFEAGTYDLANGSTHGTDDFSGLEILTIDEYTTIQDLADAMTEVLRTRTESSNVEVQFNSTNGSFRFIADEFGFDGIEVNIAGTTGNQIFHDIFVQSDDTGDYSRDLDVVGSSSTLTRTMRQADVTTTIDVFDSQGNPRTVTVAYAMDTTNAPATDTMLAVDLVDEFGRSLFQVGDVLEFTEGTMLVADDLQGDDIITISATTTLQEIADAVKAVLDTADAAGTHSVTINSDGSFNINSSTAITGAKVNLTTGGVNALQALFVNSGEGADGTIEVTAGSSTNTNSFWGPNSLLNTWNWQAIMPYTIQELPANDTGTLIFTSTGIFESYGDGGTTAPALQFDPDGSSEDEASAQYNGVDPLNITLDMSSMSQFANENTASIETQDGSGVGSLNTITIDSNGVIRGIFSNSKTRDLAQIQVASVPNEGGLLKVGDTFYQESANSGIIIMGYANESGRGSVVSGTLELSNVDLASEFTDIIVSQRGFQANARVITTGDEILTELVNMKR